MTCIVLAITPDAAAASALQKVIGRARIGYFELEWCYTLRKGLARIAQGGIDAIIGDFLMPDAKGMGVFQSLLEAAPLTPILMICDPGYEDLGVETIRLGGQGYIPKKHCLNVLIPHMLSNIVAQSFVKEKFSALESAADIMLNTIGDGVLSADSSGTVTFVNAGAERMTGWTAAEAIGHPVLEILRTLDGETRMRTPISFRFSREASQERFQMEAILISRDGNETRIAQSIAPIYDRCNRFAGAVIVLRDLGVARPMDEITSFHAYHDFLTNLPNRLLLNDRIQRSTEYARRNFTHVAVLFLDIDNFKTINDSYGHSTGDRLLQSVAKRLVDTVRGSDTVGRLGGDEFVVLLLEDNDEENIEIATQKILAAIAMPHLIEGREFHVTASIGVSIYPEDGREVETLIDHADVAMYRAKQGGRNGCRFFREASKIEVSRH